MKLALTVPALLLVVMTAATARAGVNGAIAFSDSNGAAVKKNVYSAKDDAYLGGTFSQLNGRVADGRYYFQITDPSGAALLSQDALECRVLLVARGRIAGTDPARRCQHGVGLFDAASGAMPVQLAPFSDTPSSRGEYKAWITPVEALDLANCGKGQPGAFGFCEVESVVDSFKVRLSNAPDTAYVSVCTFYDFNGDGVQGEADPIIPSFPIVASGVDGGLVAAQTSGDGCVTFTVSNFGGAASKTVVITEGKLKSGWVQTAPGTDAFTLEVSPSQDVTGIAFGYRTLPR